MQRERASGTFLGRRRRASAACAALLCLPTLAAAATCTVSALPLAFGVYNPLASAPNHSTGQVSVNCQAELVTVMQNYSLALSSGGAGGFAPRRLSSGAGTLDYQLYSDPVRTLVWGDGSAGAAVVHGSFFLAIAVPMSAAHLVYGRIPALQSSAAPATYADTIVVTITY